MKSLYLCVLVALVGLVPVSRAEPVAPSAAPAWKLVGLDGKAISSDQFKGKVVVIDFWATWGPPCRAEIPGYVELQKKYGKDGLVIVGASMDQAGVEVVKKFVEKYGVSYTIVMGDDDVFRAFGGGESIPMTVIVDRSGNIRDRKVGAVPTAEYEKVVKSFL